MAGGRSYGDASYGAKKTIELPLTAVMDGTGTAVTLNSQAKVMYPMTVQDFNLHTAVAGTGVSVGDVVLGSQLAGTGTFAPFGTATLTGTQAIYSIISGSVTETDIAAGDTITVKLDGTGVDISTVVPRVEISERYVQSDT